MITVTVNKMSKKVENVCLCFLKPEVMFWNILKFDLLSYGSNKIRKYSHFNNVVLLFSLKISQTDKPTIMVVCNEYSVHCSRSTSNLNGEFPHHGTSCRVYPSILYFHTVNLPAYLHAHSEVFLLPEKRFLFVTLSFTKSSTSFELTKKRKKTGG